MASQYSLNDQPKLNKSFYNETVKNLPMVIATFLCVTRTLYI